MRRWWVAALGLVIAAPGAAEVEDTRMVVEVPAEIAQEIRAEMRRHMDTLDDVMAALAAGDFEEAATIAELRMDFGHRVWERMAAAGKSEAEILALRERLRELGVGPGRGRGQGQAQGQGGGMGMGGGGPGRFLPDDFRAMGQVFHAAAREFAATARAVDDPPTAAQYADVLGALQFVTSTCRSCHATWRFE